MTLYTTRSSDHPYLVRSQKPGDQIRVQTTAVSSAFNHRPSYNYTNCGAFSSTWYCTAAIPTAPLKLPAPLSSIPPITLEYG